MTKIHYRNPRFALRRNAPLRFTGNRGQLSLGNLSLGNASMIRPINSASMFLQWCGIPSPLLVRMSRGSVQASHDETFTIPRTLHLARSLNSPQSLAIPLLSWRDHSGIQRVFDNCYLLCFYSLCFRAFNRQLVFSINQHQQKTIS